MMSNLQAVAEFEKHNFKFERLIWLASVIPSGRFWECLMEYGYDVPEIAEALGVEDPDWNAAQSDAVGFLEDWVGLEQKLGFLVLVYTPSPDPNTGAHSWQICTLRWFYGETLDDVVAQAKRWSEEVSRGDY